MEKRERKEIDWIDRKPIIGLDVETTGLKASSDALAEIAALHLDRTACVKSVYQGPTLVRFSPGRLAVEKSRMNDYVLNMHTKNGLLDELEAAEGAVTLEELDDALVEWVESLELKDRPRVGGSNVPFDRSFVEVNLPKFHKLTHFRNADSSTLWEFFEACKVEVEVDKSNYKHRALGDIEFSMASYKAYVDHVTELERFYKAHVDHVAELERLASTRPADGLDE